VNQNRSGRSHGANLFATVASQRLADYSLGSLESRAAARVLLQARTASQAKGVLVRVVFIGKPEEGQDSREKVCTCKDPPADTFALCRCFT
jgi:hypothetical protein